GERQAPAAIGFQRQTLVIGLAVRSVAHGGFKHVGGAGRSPVAWVNVHVARVRVLLEPGLWPLAELVSILLHIVCRDAVQRLVIAEGISPEAARFEVGGRGSQAPFIWWDGAFGVTRLDGAEWRE